MITFFRKLRASLLAEGKTGKYLKYAIGEIILVVIGILIALSINNWNEDRKESSIEQNYLKRLLIDIESDYGKLTLSKGLSQERINQINLLTDVIKNPVLVNTYPKQIIVSIEKISWRSYLPLSRIVYSELLSSGNMSLIQSENLRESLLKYYGTADHWEMILNQDDCQKEFIQGTAGLLSAEILAAIENSEWIDSSKSTHFIDINIEEEEVARIVEELSSNSEAIRWMPKIYHYHVLSEKIIENLLSQNEALKNLILSELNDTTTSNV